MSLPSAGRTGRPSERPRGTARARRIVEATAEGGLGMEDAVGIDEFKRFVLRGNVIDLGVGVVMGIAFKSVVDSLVADMLTPLIAMIGGNADFSALVFTLNGSAFAYGNFVNVTIAFAITAIVVFYFVVAPTNHVISRYAEEETPEPTTRKCPFCVPEISKRALRCPFCTAEVPPVVAA